MADLPMFTSQTRINLPPPKTEVLDAYADLSRKVERTLFAATQPCSNSTKLQHEYQLRFGLTARQFNAARVGRLAGRFISGFLNGKVTKYDSLAEFQNHRS